LADLVADVGCWANRCRVEKRERASEPRARSEPSKRRARARVGVSYPIPSGETTFENAWSSDPTVFKWRATLNGGAFGGRRTEEEVGAGTNGGDTCYDENNQPPFGKYDEITSGNWPVASDNTYGDDFVGWYSTSVDWYRLHGQRIPCMTDFHQAMTINRRGSPYTLYQTNWLKAGIEWTSVWSERDGHAISKDY